MALTILSQPTDVLIPSQNYCGNLCFDLQSDVYINSAGLDAELVYVISGLPGVDTYIEIQGLRLTFRAAMTTLQPNEAYVPANVTDFGNLVADFFDSALPEITAVYSTGPEKVTFTRDAFYLRDFDNSITYDNNTGVLSATYTNGLPYNFVSKYTVKYQAFIDNELIFEGNVSPKVVRDKATKTISVEIKIDVSALPKQFVKLQNNYTSSYPTLMASMVLKFAEQIGNAGSSYISSNTIQLMHASCDCADVTYEDYLPGNSGKKFLYIEGSSDAMTLCSGDSLLLYGLGEAGLYTPLVNDVAPDIFPVIDNPQLGGIKVDFTPFIGAQNNQFDVGLTAQAGSNEIGPLIFYRNTFATAECCNLSQILFLNCLGGWQYFGITKERGAGIEVQTLDYVNCKTCGGASKTRTAFKSTKITATYFTRPLKLTPDNMKLLESFLNSTSFLDKDGNAIRVRAEEVAIELTGNRIQIPFTVERDKDRYGLIDHWYNSNS